MAKGIKVDVIGVKATKTFLNLKAVKAMSLANEGIVKATFHIQNKIKESISRGTNAPVTVDTGRFLNSVTAGKGVVYTKVPYAKFLEYGTVKFKARPHFRNTAFKEKDAVQKMIKSEVKRL